MLDKTNMSGVIYIWVELYILDEYFFLMFHKIDNSGRFQPNCSFIGLHNILLCNISNLEKLRSSLESLNKCTCLGKNIFKTSGNKEISVFQCNDLPYQHQTLIIEEFEPDVFRLLPISKDVIYINRSTMDSPWLDKS